MSHRAPTDVWILAAPKVPYYGAYPNGFLERARVYLGVRDDEVVLHVCGGRVKDYPNAARWPNDLTVDMDPQLRPDFLADVRHGIPAGPKARRKDPSADGWAAILVDRPYTEEDAAHYAPGAGALPDVHELVRSCLERVRLHGRVGVLDYVWPRPPALVQGLPVRQVAGPILVTPGWGRRVRTYNVYQKG